MVGNLNNKSDGYATLELVYVVLVVFFLMSMLYSVFKLHVTLVNTQYNIYRTLELIVLYHDPTKPIKEHPPKAEVIKMCEEQVKKIFTSNTNHYVNTDVKCSIDDHILISKITTDFGSRLFHAAANNLFRILSTIF